MNLDQLLRDEGIDLIVCDVEGAETFLFDDADLSGVDRIFLEMHDHVTGLSGVRRLFATMAGHGFVYDPRHSTGSVVLFQRLGGAGHRPPLRRVRPSADGHRRPPPRSPRGSARRASRRRRCGSGGRRRRRAGGPSGSATAQAGVQKQRRERDDGDAGLAREVGEDRVDAGVARRDVGGGGRRRERRRRASAAAPRASGTDQPISGTPPRITTRRPVARIAATVCARPARKIARLSATRAGRQVARRGRPGARVALGLVGAAALGGERPAAGEDHHRHVVAALEERQHRVGEGGAAMVGPRSMRSTSRSGAQAVWLGDEAGLAGRASPPPRPPAAPRRRASRPRAGSRPACPARSAPKRQAGDADHSPMPRQCVARAGGCRRRAAKTRAAAGGSRPGRPFASADRPRRRR